MISISNDIWRYFYNFHSQLFFREKDILHVRIRWKRERERERRKIVRIIYGRIFKTSKTFISSRTMNRIFIQSASSENLLNSNPLYISQLIYILEQQRKFEDLHRNNEKNKNPRKSIDLSFFLSHLDSTSDEPFLPSKYDSQHIH